MQFKKVNSKNMRLSDDANVSKTYTRQVEANSRLAQMTAKSSERKKDEEEDKSFVENSAEDKIHESGKI